MTLIGIEKIAEHLGKDEKLVLSWIKDYSLPAMKKDGIYVADDQSVSRWAAKFYLLRLMPDIPIVALNQIISPPQVKTGSGRKKKH